MHVQTRIFLASRNRLPATRPNSGTAWWHGEELGWSSCTEAKRRGQRPFFRRAERCSRRDWFQRVGAAARRGVGAAWPCSRLRCGSSTASQRGDNFDDVVHGVRQLHGAPRWWPRGCSSTGQLRCFCADGSLHRVSIASSGQRAWPGGAGLGLTSRFPLATGNSLESR